MAHHVVEIDNLSVVFILVVQQRREDPHRRSGLCLLGN